MKRLYVLSLQGLTIALSACNQQKSSTLQNVDTALQTTDTISSEKHSMTFALRTGIEVIGWIMNISVLCENTWMIIIKELSAILI